MPPGEWGAGVIEELTIVHRGDTVERAVKRGTTLELLASCDGIEVTRQSVATGRHFFLYAADEWIGFELLYVLEGRLAVEPEAGVGNGEEAIYLSAGDYLYHNGLPKKVYFRVEERAEFLMINSAPSFDLMKDRVRDMVEMARSVEKKDHATDGHCLRLEKLAIKTGEKLGLLGQALIDISYASYLHDLGKIKLPGEILGKEDPLTDGEWEQMKRHPDLGAEMLREKDFLHGAARIVRAHHERFDGSGYPLGLKGDEIPIGARVIAVVDAYDAMTSARPYKEAQDSQAAIEEITRAAGKEFDPRVVDVFIEVVGAEDAE